MNATTAAAWWGAASGTAVLLWDVIKWYGTRADLFVRANGGHLFQASVYDDGPDRYISVTIDNRGRAPTTVTGLAVGCYKNRWVPRWKLAEDAFLIGNLKTKQPLPCRLDPGDEWNGLTLENEEMKEAGASGKVILWVTVSHRNKPIRSKVDYSISEKLVFEPEA